jgi:hypothetical protein
MAVSLPAIKIMAVATTLISMSVNMAMTSAAPRSARPRYLPVTFTVPLLVRIKSNRLPCQSNCAKLPGLRIGLRRLHD